MVISFSPPRQSPNGRWQFTKASTYATNKGANAVFTMSLSNTSAREDSYRLRKRGTCGADRILSFSMFSMRCLTAAASASAALFLPSSSCGKTKVMHAQLAHSRETNKQQTALRSASSDFSISCVLSSAVWRRLTNPSLQTRACKLPTRRPQIHLKVRMADNVAIEPRCNRKQNGCATRKQRDTSRVVCL